MHLMLCIQMIHLATQLLLGLDSCLTSRAVRTHCLVNVACWRTEKPKGRVPRRMNGAHPKEENRHSERCLNFPKKVKERSCEDGSNPFTSQHRHNRSFSRSSWTASSLLCRESVRDAIRCAGATLEWPGMSCSRNWVTIVVRCCFSAHHYLTQSWPSKDFLWT